MRTFAVLGLLAASIVATGCNLISGLSDLKVGDGGGTTTSTGGTGGSGGTTTSGGGGTTTGGSGGTTTSSEASCSNGVKDAASGETDVDCGGPCPACSLGDVCAVNADCVSGICRLDAASGNPDKQCVGVTAIAAGSAHACAVLSTRELFCWGANGHGQLGNGNNLDSSSPVKINVANVAGVSVGGLADDKDMAHSCALSGGGDVFCWGANGSGQLGTGDTQDVNLPLLTPVLSSAKAIAAGGVFTCAIQMNDGVACWGANAANELGNGTGTASSTPIAPNPAVSASAIAAGAHHVCAVIGDASVRCWGGNLRGQIGSASLVPAGPQTAVPTVMSASIVRAGSDASCAIDAAGLACWGDNLDGELTDAAVGDESSNPIAIDVAGAIDVAMGSDGDGEPNDPRGGHACTVVTGGKILCWGNNRHGQLGRGGATDLEKVPAEVTGVTGAVSVAAGAEITCARFESGAAACWGRNDRGQLGAGKLTDTESSPVPIAWP